MNDTPEAPTMAAALDALLPWRVNSSEAGTSLSIVPGWVFRTGEYQDEYAELSARHNRHWLFIPYRQPVPDDTTTKAMAAAKTMRVVAQKLYALAKAIDTHAGYVEGSLQTNEAVCA